TAKDQAIQPPQSSAVKIELDRAGSLVMIPGPISQDGGTGDALKRLAAEQACLAQVIYFEARGENEAGRRAVAEVILHRLAEGGHGNTICKVVYEGAGETFCQFTFACDGSLERPMNFEAWRSAQVLAARLMAGEVPADATAGATYYHAVSVHPTWAPTKLRLVQIGHHVFYRDRMADIGPMFRGSLQ
ncbi:MAG: cell wall hydrolase, partial [Acetobacteraceae bacterium]|nr:cell wall hydrolase [Acetobacteraceae bacterium]